MSGGWLIWRRRLTLWLIPAVGVLLNLAALGFYRFAFAGDVEFLERQVERATGALEELQEERREAEELLAIVDRNRAGLQELHEVRFATEAERFTRAIATIKQLAGQAGLDPQSIAYPRQEVGEQSLIEQRISFSVEGSYSQIRTFINLLELADDFLILESVSLNESGQNVRDPRLNIGLVVTTLFSESSEGHRETAA